MNLGIMHPTIEANQFELKSMILQMPRTIGQFKKWLEVWWTWDAKEQVVAQPTFLLRIPMNREEEFRSDY